LKIGLWSTVVSAIHKTFYSKVAEIKGAEGQNGPGFGD
jgi:hypothetical protein